MRTIKLVLYIVGAVITLIGVGALIGSVPFDLSVIATPLGLALDTAGILAVILGVAIILYASRMK